VNADGRLDLVLRGRVGVGGASIVGVAFGEAGGSFSAPLVVSSTLSVDFVHAADLTGDGHDDLVLLPQLPGEPPLLLVWEPHGGFVPPAVILPIDADGLVHLARSEDLDEDGRNDLVLVDSGSRVMVLLQQPDGTLAAPLAYAAWPNVREVLLADVDENGSRDVLTIGSGPATLLAGTGTGSFGPALGLPDRPRDLAAADFDGDGRDELVSLDDDGSPLLVHGADAFGGWGVPAEVDVGSGARRIVAGRFTDDEPPDLLVVRGGEGSSALLLVQGKAGGGFEPPLVTPLAFTAAWGWTVDVDDDGLLDVLVTEIPPATIHVLQNTGGGAFAETALLGPFQSPRKAAGSDLTGDGKTDVVVASVEGNGRLSVFPGVGDGTFLAPIVTDMAVPSWPQNLALGDVDRDGSVDAAFYVGVGSTVILPGLGDGSFGLPEVLGGKILEQLELVDLDRDGLLDLVGARSGTTPFEFGTVHVRYGTGTLAFGPTVSTPSPGGAFRLVVADPDGDGAPDLALASELPQLVVLRNPLGPWQELGHSLAGSNGFSRLSGVGTLQPGSAVELLVTHGPAAAPTTLVLGLGELLAPFQGGVLVPTPDVLVPGLLTDGAGGIALAGHWPPGHGTGHPDRDAGLVRGHRETGRCGRDHGPDRHDAMRRAWSAV
jgi:hypothetical protein